MSETRTIPRTAAASERLSLEIVDLIADREGTNPTELTPPLNSVVDPDALDSLFDPSVRGESRTTGTVSFRYCSYEVHVRSGGEVTVERA